MSQCKNNNCCNNGKNSKVLLEERKEINVLYEWKWKCLTFNVIMTPNNYITFHPVYSAGTAVIRGDIPFLSNHHYFWEFQICNNIYGTDIMFGIGTRTVSLSDQKYTFCSLLGLDEDSYGYSYHGFIQHDDKKYRYGLKFNQGALVGVYLDMFKGTLEFYVDRVPLGIAFKDLKNKELYPMVSSTTANSMIKLTNAHVHRENLQLRCLRVIATNTTLMRELKNVPGLRDLLINQYVWLTSNNCNTPNIYIEATERIKNGKKLNNYCTAA